MNKGVYCSITTLKILIRVKQLSKSVFQQFAGIVDCRIR